MNMEEKNIRVRISISAEQEELNRLNDELVLFRRHEGHDVVDLPCGAALRDALTALVKLRAAAFADGSWYLVDHPYGLPATHLTTRADVVERILQEVPFATAREAEREAKEMVDIAVCVEREKVDVELRQLNFVVSAYSVTFCGMSAGDEVNGCPSNADALAARKALLARAPQAQAELYEKAVAERDKIIVALESEVKALRAAVAVSALADDDDEEDA